MNKDIIARALQHAGIEKLNEMQEATLAQDEKRDIVLLSPTGSGKTLAFLLPLITRLRGKDAVTEALIIAPSRELALQIESVFRSLGTGYKVNCCYGGHPMRTEKKSLEHPPAVLIGTPGRLLDHLERGNIDLSQVHTLVLDEFDKSLEFGFTAEMKDILKEMPHVRRRILTSATDSVDIPAFTGLDHPVRLSFLQEKRQSGKLSVYMVQSPVKDKLETLYGLLGETGGGATLVFCNLREAVERVSNYLTSRNVENEYFHGGMEQPERERALSRFRNGSANVFIATDLAARGLDIPEVAHVIHYHLPLNEEAWIHRNGRTARMDTKGNAFLILNEVETLPEYISPEPPVFYLPETPRTPIAPEWVTLGINRGKRDKLSKKDVAGFLMQKGELKKEDVGIIEIREGCSYVAVKREKKHELLSRIKEEKIKNMRAKFD